MCAKGRLVTVEGFCGSVIYSSEHSATVHTDCTPKQCFLELALSEERNGEITRGKG